jgi:integrase
VVVHGDGDQPPHQNTVGYWWRKTLRVAGLSDIKLHDLRHCYASGLIGAGCDLVTVQRSLGHAKATTTLNTYAHLWPTAEDRTRKAARSIIDASLGHEDRNHNSKIGLYVGTREVADQFAP